MYNSTPTVVYGFHATDKKIAEKLVNCSQDFTHSQNDSDWLGEGIYFWENNLKRAIDYGDQLKNRMSSLVKNPTVVGAIIDLGNCFDLLNQEHLDFLKVAQKDLIQSLESRDLPIPKNSNRGKNDFDFKGRYLDCAVIRWAHKLANDAGEKFDSVRAAFWEGAPLYKNAGFKEQNHIQIAVINPNCIKGIFYPRKLYSTRP